MASPIAAGGLVLDIAGGLTLASAFMFKRSHQRQAESGSYLDWNASLELSLAKQTADAWVGGALLTAGFGAQLLAATGWHSTTADFEVTVSLAIAVALLFVAILRRALHAWHVRRAIVERLLTRDTGEWPLILVSYGRLLRKEPCRGEETPAAYGLRLLGRRQWQRLSGCKDLQQEMFEVYPPR